MAIIGTLTLVRFSNIEWKLSDVKVKTAKTKSKERTIRLTPTDITVQA